MDHDSIGCSSGKFSGATERLKRKSCSCERNAPNGNSCAISSKPSLIQVSGLCGRFSENRADLFKW